jgi:hypothetical protein
MQNAKFNQYFESREIQMKPLVVGYPRTGFSLLISVIQEILIPSKSLKNEQQFLKQFCDNEGMSIAESIKEVFAKRGLLNRLIYNYNFQQMVGGPKWIKEDQEELACFRKYIGIKGMGDFTLFTSHPRKVLHYYDIIHSHVGPQGWIKHASYFGDKRFSSIRNPAGTVTSACFSLNALASEYIQKYLPAKDDNDELRQRMALYKLTDMNFFEALLGPFKSYLVEFSKCDSEYYITRWEDLIDKPIETITKVSRCLNIELSLKQVQDIWSKLGHVNLTGAHKHNFRKGHGIVGGWKNWITNHHLSLLREYGFEPFFERWGYGPIEDLNHEDYSPFQKKVSKAIEQGKILREYDDKDLFGLAFNKSNVDLSRFDFKQYEWRKHTRIERSSCPDDELVMEVSNAAENSCRLINNELSSL